MKTNPDAQLQDCLKLWYDEAITKLKLDEFNVLDDIDKISLKLTPQNALAVHAKTTRCRQVILENKKEDTFKRRILLVKYADRTQQEIAKRLVRTSLATIEHIKPNSEEGENNIANFMLTSAGANNLRSNMPLYKFINMFPNIPKYCQKHINQIIELILPVQS